MALRRNNTNLLMCVVQTNFDERTQYPSTILHSARAMSRASKRIGTSARTSQRRCWLSYRLQSPWHVTIPLRLSREATR
jgi:hypothetical protein